jgi:predicted transcriptional regulator
MKRSKELIISQILEVCLDGAIKTSIVYQTNLNFKRIDFYLERLMDSGFIRAEQGKGIFYKTTDKGFRTLEKLKDIHSELSQV